MGYGRQFGLHVLFAGPVGAQEPDCAKIRAAVEKAMVPMQRGLGEFQARWNPPPDLPIPPVFKEIGCISCHHEGLGLSTLSFLREQGFRVDEVLADKQARKLSLAYEKLAPGYRRALTDKDAEKQADFFEDIAVQMGYMLGGLLDSGHARDESTDAAVRLLMKFQQEDGSWSFTIPREPMESSDFATTAMAAGPERLAEMVARVQPVLRRRLPPRQEPVHLAARDLLRDDGPVAGG